MSGLFRRVLGAYTAPLLAIAAVTLVAAVLAGVALPLLGALATAGTRADLDRATARERDLETTFSVTEARTPAADAQRAFDGVAAALSRARQQVPPALRAVTERPGWVASTAPRALDGVPSRLGSAISFLADPDAGRRVRWAAGRAPATATDGTAVEIALSSRVASVLGWRVGEVRTAGEGTASMRLVGVYEPRDASDPAWAHTPDTLRPGQAPGAGGNSLVLGAAYVAPGSFGAIVASGRATQGRAWIPVSSAGVTADGRDALSEQVRSFLTTRSPFPSTLTRNVRFTTSLPDLLAASAAKDATVGTLAAALGSGPAGALVALGVLLARLVLDRAGTVLRLLGARGASRAAVRAGAAGLVAVAAVPAAVVGGTVAALVQRLPVGPVTPSVVDAAVAALLVAVVPCAAAAVAAPVERVGAPRRPVRVLVECAVVVVAVAAAVVTVRAGVTAGSPGGRVDPLAAVLPVLLAAVGVVVVLRLLPVVLAAVVARGRRRRGAGLLVGTATAARDTVGQAVPLAVAVVGIAVALFSTVVGSTLEGGVAEAARRSVAADVSVDSPGLDAGAVATIGRVGGVAAVAGVSTSDAVTFDTPHGSVGAVVLVADTRRLAAVQRGVPGAVPTPGALRSRDHGRVPVLASADLAAAIGRDARIGTEDTRVVGTSSDPSPFTAARRWVLVDARFADDVSTSGSVDRVLVRTAAGARADQVAGAVRRAVPVDAVTTADARQRTLEADPRIPGTRVVAATAAVAGGMLGVGALVVSALLAGRRRRDRARLLDVLGQDPRGARAVVVAEAVPTLVAALVVGAVVAAATVTLTLPSADLRSFTGATVRPTVVVDPVLLAVVVGVVLLALAGVLLLAVRTGTLPRTRTRTRTRTRARSHTEPPTGRTR